MPVKRVVRMGFQEPTTHGVYERTLITNTPAELHTYLVNPKLLQTTTSVQERLLNTCGHTAICVNDERDLDVDTLRDSVAFAMSLCTKSLLAVSVAQCPVRNPQAWQLLLQGVATCPHVTVLDLAKTHFTREAAQELVSSVLPRCRALQELNLSENPSLRDEGVLLVLRGITRSDTPLQKLGLRDVGIRDLGIVVRKLMDLPMLCQVDLSGNPSSVPRKVSSGLKDHLEDNFHRMYGVTEDDAVEVVLEIPVPSSSLATTPHLSLSSVSSSFSDDIGSKVVTFNVASKVTLTHSRARTPREIMRN